ncbi:hypothetical protein CCP1ISM_90010 [Azospirillaceae bacterium]
MKKQNKLQKLALQIGMVCGIMTAIVGATKETAGLVKDWIGSDNKEEISKMKDEITSLRREVRMLRREVSNNPLTSLASLMTRSPATSVPPSAIITESASPASYAPEQTHFRIGFIAAIAGLLLTISLAIVYHFKHRKPKTDLRQSAD